MSTETPVLMNSYRLSSPVRASGGLEEMSFCPFVRHTKWGPLVVNPYLTNRQRLVLLGSTLLGENWRLATSRLLSCERCTIIDWLGKRPGGDKGREPPDAAIRELMRAARRKVDQIEFALEEVRLPPWLDV